MAGNDCELILLDLWCSPFAIRVRIALREKALEFESREQDLENKSSLLLEMNPVNKQLPVLIHNGKPVCESNIIVQYIDETWSQKSPLLPADPYGRANARFWADYIDKKLYTAARSIFVDEKRAKEEIVECFKVLESELGEKPYFGGNIFGLVDITLASLSSMFNTWEKCANFSLSDECPKLASWAKRCADKDSVAKSNPDPIKIYHHFTEIRKKFFPQHKS